MVRRRSYRTGRRAYGRRRRIGYGSMRRRGGRRRRRGRSLGSSYTISRGGVRL